MNHHVWTVHVTRPNEVRPTEVVFTSEVRACQHAEELSRDPGVLAAGVVRFSLNELGTRHGVALYVQGQRQRVPYVSDCRTIR